MAQPWVYAGEDVRDLIPPSYDIGNIDVINRQYLASAETQVVSEECRSRPHYTPAFHGADSENRKLCAELTPELQRQHTLFYGPGGARCALQDHRTRKGKSSSLCEAVAVSCGQTPTSNATRGSGGGKLLKNAGTVMASPRLAIGSMLRPKHGGSLNLRLDALKTKLTHNHHELGKSRDGLQVMSARSKVQCEEARMAQARSGMALIGDIDAAPHSKEEFLTSDQVTRSIDVRSDDAPDSARFQANKSRHLDALDEVILKSGSKGPIAVKMETMRFIANKNLEGLREQRGHLDVLNFTEP